jgi:PAS domain S-box-containing protein
MNSSLFSPAFGQADLTNCERELIHLAGSIQPHGALLVVDESKGTVLQVSANAEEVLGIPVDRLLNRPLAALGGDVTAQLAHITDLATPRPFRCHSGKPAAEREYEALVHRNAAGLILELDPVRGELDDAKMQRQLAAAVQRFGAASSIATLSEAVVSCVREMTGYDRVMVYKFDPDGHGEIIAEARQPRLESFLGLHYPSTDIPQRARELYIRNRVRTLVDIDYTPVPVMPRRSPATGEELDMSLCYLRSMSPLHIQYLKNMGVTATMVVSLVREGRLWGLIACHHYSPLHVGYALRAAHEVLAEVISTRIAAIENYALPQNEVMVRRLEQRLLEATSIDGDWRLALFGNSRTLLQPLEASGAALFYADEILTAGEVPSTPELRSLVQWVAEQGESPFVCASVSRANPSLSSLTPTACGVLAIEISRTRPDYLMWFRKEQPCTVTWAGDPAKSVVGNDPLELSPRRSFAAWLEIVRGTAAAWSPADVALARAIGASLTDIIVQIQAVRLLITHHQYTQVRLTVENSREPIVIADPGGRILFANEAFSRMFQRPHLQLQQLEDISALFTDAEEVRTILRALRGGRSWRGELTLATGGVAIPVGLRADVVPGQTGTLGYFLILTDLTDSKRAQAARLHLERSLSHVDAARAGPARVPSETDDVIGAILSNASVAAIEIADTASGPSAAQLLEELEAATKRATELYGQMRSYQRSS